MKNVIVTTVIFSILSATAVFSHATEKMNMEQMQMPAKTSSAHSIVSAKGRVIAISKDKSKVTLKHEPIPVIEWPAMTMEFKVKSSKLLAKTQVGDKVSFTMVPIGKDYMVTSIK